MLLKLQLQLQEVVCLVVLNLLLQLKQEVSLEEVVVALHQVIYLEYLRKKKPPLLRPHQLPHCLPLLVLVLLLPRLRLKHLWVNLALWLVKDFLDRIQQQSKLRLKHLWVNLAQCLVNLFLDRIQQLLLPELKPHKTQTRLEPLPYHLTRYLNLLAVALLHLLWKQKHLYSLLNQKQKLLHPYFNLLDQQLRTLQQLIHLTLLLLQQNLMLLRKKINLRDYLVNLLTSLKSPKQVLSKHKQLQLLVHLLLNQKQSLPPNKNNKYRSLLLLFLKLMSQLMLSKQTYLLLLSHRNNQQLTHLELQISLLNLLNLSPLKSKRNRKKSK